MKKVTYLVTALGLAAMGAQEPALAQAQPLRTIVVQEAARAEQERQIATLRQHAFRSPTHRLAFRNMDRLGPRDAAAATLAM